MVLARSSGSKEILFAVIIVQSVKMPARWEFLSYPILKGLEIHYALCAWIVYKFVMKELWKSVKESKIQFFFAFSPILLFFLSYKPCITHSIDIINVLILHMEKTLSKHFTLKKWSSLLNVINNLLEIIILLVVPKV